MATNQQIAQAFQSLRIAFSAEVRPRIVAVSRQVGNGALWSEVETEVASIRAELDSLYGQIQQFLSDARSNDPQDPDLIAQLETSLNTNRANNFSALAQLEELARGSEQQQVEAESEFQEDTAAAQVGPGTVSAGDVAAAAAAAKDFMSQNPASLPDVITQAQGQLTNAIPAIPGLPAAPANIPKLPGATSPTGSATAATGVDSLPAVGSLSFEPENQPKTVEQSFVYRVTTVTSRFSHGRFEQDIEGTIVNFDDIVTRTNTQTAPAVVNPAPSETQRQPTETETIGRVTGGAIENTGQVDFAGSEFGAYFGDGTTGGEVNFTPTGLANVLDQRAGTNPITNDLLGAQGFGDPTAEAATEPPTSDGQPVDQFAQTDPGEVPGVTTQENKQLIARDD